MNFILTCNCPPPESDCSLEEELKAILEGTFGFGQVQIYTGDLATQGDTGNIGPAIPYAILSDLGANNSLMAGENLVQYEVVVRLRLYTTTDRQGLLLARLATKAWRDAGEIETADGYACMNSIPARARPLKIGYERWMTQINQTFFIHTLIS